MATVLLLHGDGANASTTILDEVGHAVTVNGNAQISTAQYKFNSSSLLFDGTGDSLATASSSDFGFGTGDYTLECWVKTSTKNTVVFDTRTTSHPAVFYVANTTGRISYYASSQLSGSTTDIADGNWHHLAWCRASGTLRMFVDGVQEYSAANSDDLGASRPIVIGLDYTGAAGFNGYIDEVRVNKGEALYTAAFTPPTAQFFHNNTVLLLHGDGTNGSTTIKDETGKTVTANGNAQISTAQSKFGGASIAFDGTGDYLSVADTADLEFGANDFTLEAWVYPNSVSGTFGICGKQDGSFTYQGYVFYITTGGVINVSAVTSDNNTAWTTTISSSSGALTTGTWQHVAAVRRSGTLYIYVDGTQVATGAFSLAIVDNSSGLAIGALKTDGNFSFNGYLDDVRICKAAKYTAAFTPPTAAHDYEYTKLLIHADGANNATSILEAVGRAVTVNGNAKISTTQSKFGGSAMYFDGTGDYVDIPASSDFAGVSRDMTIEFWVYTDPATAAWSRTIENVEYDSATKGWHFSFNGSDSAGSRRLGFQLSNSGGGGSRLESNAALPTSQWVHVAFVRYNNTGYMYINGTQQTATLNLSSYSFDATSLRLGANLGTPGSYLTGYLDEVRLSVGIARYTANFTPTTDAFSLLGQYVPTITGLVRDDTGAFAARTVRLYRRDTGALVTETTSNGTTGAFTFSGPADLTYYVVFLDDDSGTQYNAKIYDRVTRG